MKCLQPACVARENRKWVPHTFLAEDVNDLYAYDPASMAWTNLSATASGAPPSPRAFHGFTSAGGKLYVHGGEFCDPDCGEAEGSPGLQRMRRRFPAAPAAQADLCQTPAASNAAYA